MLEKLLGAYHPPYFNSNNESILNNSTVCNSLEEVRTHIDSLDRQIVALLAARGGFVMQAARFKKTTDDVKAPQRVEQVIAKVRALAVELGANPAVTEAVYRAMIAAFINAELTEHTVLATSQPKP
jgi:isochorismate pyruvate lyase